MAAGSRNGTDVELGEGSRTALSAAFGQLIRERRQGQKVSQEELAARARLDRTFVGRVERGEFRVSLENAQALAQACGEPLWRMLQLLDQTQSGDEV